MQKTPSLPPREVPSFFRAHILGVLSLLTAVAGVYHVHREAKKQVDAIVSTDQLQINIQPIFTYWDSAAFFLKQITQQDIETLDRHFTTPTTSPTLHSSLNIGHDVNEVLRIINQVEAAIYNFRFAKTVANNLLGHRTIPLNNSQKRWLHYINARCDYYISLLQRAIGPISHSLSCEVSTSGVVQLGEIMTTTTTAPETTHTSVPVVTPDAGIRPAQHRPRLRAPLRTRPVAGPTGGAWGDLGGDYGNLGGRYSGQ